MYSPITRKGLKILARWYLVICVALEKIQEALVWSFLHQLLNHRTKASQQAILIAKHPCKIRVFSMEAQSTEQSCVLMAHG